MAASAPMPLTRLDELLADQALVGLTSEERAELDGLLAGSPEADESGYERAAAAALLALTGFEDEPLPPGLRRLVESGAGRALTPPARARTAAPPHRRRGLGARESLAWAVAAAALAFALLPATPSDPDAGLRERLAADGGTLTFSWTATEDPSAVGATGQVLWNGALQQGVMTFSGLAANDPSESQYQLWIFDAARSEAQPVDGGVFDISTSEGEVVVPIRAKLAVETPTLFAITIERPGGVVVSNRERLPLLAKVGG